MAEIVSPAFLAQVGRDLIRRGESLHAIRTVRGGLALVPVDAWHFEGGDWNPATWRVQATAYGPSSSTTWTLPVESCVFVQWGASTAAPYQGVGPLGFAGTTARLGAQAERSLADEASGPVAQILPVPQDGGDGSDDDPLAQLKLDIAAAKGRAVLTETTAAGWGEGRAGAPMADWKANRLGPNPPATMPETARDAFARVLAACGASPALFDDSDGTSKREALRQWFMGTVRPLARILERELSVKLEADISLTFDGYPMDLQSRATTFQKLVAGGVSVNEALATSGLLAE